MAFGGGEGGCFFTVWDCSWPKMLSHCFPVYIHWTGTTYTEILSWTQATEHVSCIMQDFLCQS